ncbi:MAG: methyltransferase domain-containing protein [Candidatus Omnitrophica bacterium]|nr:methyltransferase domain-containing protein [Candidatus Omnitrophota bacterium]
MTGLRSWNNISGGGRVEQIDCALCGADKTTAVWVENGLTVVRCKQCGLMYTNPRDVSEATGDFFEQTLSGPEALDADEAMMWDASRRARYDEMLKRLAGFRGPGRHLDVGCGLGYFCQAAEENGWESYGVDPSRRSCVEAAKGLGMGRVFVGTLEDLPGDAGPFDLISFWDVLEHLRDPANTLKQAHALLAPGGVLFAEVPNTSFHLVYNRIRRFLERGKGLMYLMPQGHLYHYTRATLKGMLQNAGFERVDFFAGEPTRVMLVGKNAYSRTLVPLKIAYNQMAKSLFRLSRGRIYLSNSLSVFASK